jgi:hypothetical protein
MATIDHVRSRLCPNRRGSTGIVVIACKQCNNDRNDYEQAWYARKKTTGFLRRGNPPPAALDLLTAQGDLCNSLIYFLQAGGQLVGPERETKLIHKRVRKVKEHRASQCLTRHLMRRVALEETTARPPTP